MSSRTQKAIRASPADRLTVAAAHDNTRYKGASGLSYQQKFPARPDTVVHPVDAAKSHWCPWSGNKMP